MSDDAGSEIGRVLNERYRLGKILGQGSTGVVYEATDQKAPGHLLAIKLLHDRYREDRELIARLRREAQVAGQIRSRHVARVRNAGVTREGRGWIAFEHLVGESLAARLERERTLPFTDVAWIVEHTLLGLEAAHQVGVIHRDIKPGNLFIEADGPRVRVLDFGLAKRLRPADDGPVEGGASGTSALTTLGEFLGTPSYMSPEQVLNAKTIDARTDIYSTGIVAYHLMTGRVPFAHRDVGAMLQMKRVGTIAPLVRASGVTWPDALEAWIQAAAAANRAERFDSARAALTAWGHACEAMKHHVSGPGPASDLPEDTDIAPPSSG